MNSRVELQDGTVLMDITDSTVTPDTLLQGVVAYGADGERIVGTMNVADYVIETGEDATWRWSKWNSGKVELITKNQISTGTLSMSSNAGQYYSDTLSIDLPFAITNYHFSATPATYSVSNITRSSGTSNSKLYYRVIKAGNYTGSVNIKFHVIGYI